MRDSGPNDSAMDEHQAYLRDLARLRRDQKVVEGRIRKAYRSFRLENISTDENGVLDELVEKPIPALLRRALSPRYFKRILKAVNPRCLLDVAVAFAIHRLGPIRAGITDEYVSRRRHGFRQDRVLAPEVRATSGMILFQDQVVELAVRLAGFSICDAYDLARALGRTDVRPLRRFRDQFVEGAARRGIATQRAQRIFNRFESSGGYAMSQQRAIEWATLAYRHAYLQRYFGREMAGETKLDDPSDFGVQTKA